MKDRPFCLRPYKELYYRNIGITPCCLWQGDSYRENIKDYESSSYLKEIRDAMDKHDTNFLNKTCYDCIENEKNGLYSPRLAAHDNYNSKLGGITKIEYWPNNVCNLKCTMCNSYSSSLIEEEEIKLGIIKEPLEKYNTDITDYSFDNVEILRILGGEPTVSLYTQQQLQHIIDLGISKNIRLEYVTNATSYNNRWKNIADKFQYRGVGLSIDGTEKVYEYIRHGASWEHTRDNIFKIIKDSDDYEFSIVLQTTSFVLVDKWIEFFLQFPEKTIGIYQLYGIPGRISAIPNDIKERITNRLRYNDTHPVIQRIIKMFNEINFEIEELKKYKEYTMMLDKRRNRSVYDVDPIFEELLARV